MTIFFRLILLTGLFTLGINNIIKAQQVTDSSANAVVSDSTVALTDSILADLEQLTQKKSYLLAGLSYINDNVYLGRKDSVRLPYVTFNLGYYFKSGFFVDGSVNYLASSDSRVDAVNFDAGYAFTANKYSGEATVSKYFYSSKSTNVKSEVTASLSYFNSYDLGFLTPTLTGFLNFGNKTDYGAALGLEHTFYVLDDKMDFIPTFTANASTQNYYNNYYKTRRYNNKKKNQSGTASITGIVQNASKFKILDYEASLPIDYALGNFTFSASPVYAFPVNPSVVEIITTKSNNTTTTRYHTEKTADTFFITLGVTYKFGK